MKLKLIFALFEKKGKSCKSCRAEVFYKKHILENCGNSGIHRKHL